MANPVSIQRLLYVLLYFLGAAAAAAAAVPVAVAVTVVGGWVRARDGQEGNAGAVEAAGQCSRKERLRGLMCSKGRDESTRASLFE